MDEFIIDLEKVRILLKLILENKIDIDSMYSRQ